MMNLYLSINSNWQVLQDFVNVLSCKCPS